MNKITLIIIACLSFQFISCASMKLETDYDNAMKTDTLEAYEAYIHKYPNASPGIKSRYKILKDRAVYQEAEKINTKSAYQEFVQKNPSNLYLDEVRKRLSDSDKDAFARTLMIGTEKALEGYMESYPSSDYLSDARERMRWISDQNKHIAKVDIDVRNLDYGDSYAMEKKIITMLNDGLADSGIYSGTDNIAGANDRIMDVSIEYVGDPPPPPKMAEIIPMVTLGGAIPALVGVLIDEMLEGKLNRSRNKVENGYKVKISSGNDLSFDTGYYYLDELAPSYFIKLHDIIIWLKQNESLSPNTLYTVMGILDNRLRDETAKALSRTIDSDNQHFIAALSHDDWKVRESAVKVLSYKEDETIMSLIKPLANDNNYWVRIAVLKALLKYDYERTSDVYIEALNDKHEIVREAAVMVQKIVKDRQAVEPLINCLADTSKDVRAEAAWALKEIDDKRSVGALIETLADETLIVRIRAESALESITGQKFGKDIARWQEWWAQNKNSI